VEKVRKTCFRGAPEGFGGFLITTKRPSAREKKAGRRDFYAAKAAVVQKNGRQRHAKKSVCRKNRGESCFKRWPLPN